MTAAEFPSHGQHASSLCWSQLDEILRDRLAWLHHSLGSDVLPPVEAAEQLPVFLLLTGYFWQETVRSGTQTNDRLFYSSFLYCNSYFFFALPCPRCDSVVVIHFVVACCPRPHMQFNLCTFNLFIIIMMVSHSTNGEQNRLCLKSIASNTAKLFTT